MPESSLRLTEIFHSLQGESSFVGLPTVFVRLTGCPLRCVYCDTAYAFEGGERWSFDKIIEQISSFGSKYVCVTGGEPLAQPACVQFLKELCDHGFKVSLETSGAISVEDVDPRVVKVMDLKTPSSGECDRNLWGNLQFLDSKDQVKFVVGSDADFDWVLSKEMEYGLIDRVSDVLVSPVYELYPLETLADRVLTSGQKFRMQVQLHKLIWNDARGK